MVKYLSDFHLIRVPPQSLLGGSHGWLISPNEGNYESFSINKKAHQGLPDRAEKRAFIRYQQEKSADEAAAGLSRVWQESKV